MILANVTFGRRRRNEATQLEEIAETYLGAMFHSGQLCGEYFITWTRGCLNAHVLLAGRGAAEPRYHSPYGKKKLKEVIATFGVKPVWRILDDDATQQPSSWKGVSFLYVFTHAFDWASPVCRGDGKPPVPVFMLPLAFEHKEQLYRWQQSYYHHDNIWLGSGALEIGAYRQMADPESDLAQHGRDMCREIEAAIRVPTYYYLARYWGRKMDEDRRPCPGCGASWRVEPLPESPKRFWQFEFKCDNCRLVSHLGVSTDGGRHTKIGEFDEQRRAKTVQRTRSTPLRSGDKSNG